MQRVNAILRALARRVQPGRGQGTVEYVGIVLAVGALLLALAGPLNGQADAVARKITSGVTKAIDRSVNHPLPHEQQSQETS